MRRVIGILAALAAGASALPGLALTAPERAVSERAEVTLSADVAVAAPGGAVTLLLAQSLAPGWHSYWVNPGDSGMETRIAWSAPEGVSIGAIEWPTPSAIPIEPLMNYGFEGEVLLASVLRVPDAWPVGAPITLEARADWLVCADICVPESQVFTLEVPTAATATPDPVVVEMVRRARASRPVAAPFAVTFETGEKTVSLFLAAPDLADSAVGELRFFPTAWGVDLPAAPQVVARGAEGVTITLTRGETPTPTPLTGVVTAVDRSGATPAGLAFAVSATPGAAPTLTAVVAVSGGYGGDLGLGLGATPAAAAVLAFLGGLVLNLMPCVFPVLALKALAVARGADAPARERLIDGLAYGGGVLVSFLGFAAALLAFRAAGAAAGWGFQLQSPLVVALLAALLFTVGLGLAGVLRAGSVAVTLPAGLTAGPVGSFATGVLAALVASPCTAPFMGAALGFALTQPAGTVYAVFGALGLGFALPILLVGLSPALARAVPRPGPWMERFQQALAFPMWLAAAWLAWVLGALAGEDAVLTLLVALVLIGFAAWATGSGRPQTRVGRGVASGAAALAALGAVWLLASAPASSVAGGARAGAPEVSGLEGVTVEPFDPARLAALRAEGRTVFVNVTADWCISCKVNERLVLRGEAFAEGLRAANAVYMVADWTRPDAAIEAFLDGFGRVGVPLYVVFRRAAEPALLPQILLEETVLEALGRA